MTEKKEIKTFAQIEAEATEQLNTFVFVIFIPNPNTRSVRLWIDGGEIETYMGCDKFLDIINTTCGSSVRAKIEVACHEYGVPYLYDRQQDKLRELNELPDLKRFTITPDYHKTYEQDTANPYSVQNLFNASKKATKGLDNFGLPDFTPTNVRI